MLTPQEVSNHAFAKAVMGGYNMAMVDEFLDELTDDYTSLYKENAALKAKMKVLVDKVEEYRSTEDAMRAALGSEAGQAIRPAGAKFYVDLKRLNAIWLRRAGVTCIDVSADCTACQPQRFWSHRRVGNARGSLAAIIRLREEG